MPPCNMRSHGCRSIEEERSDAKYTISVSIVEIYNEMVHDLLADQGKADPELQKGPTGFTIPDLTQTGVQKTRVHLSNMQLRFRQHVGRLHWLVLGYCCLHCQRPTFKVGSNELIFWTSGRVYRD